MLKKVELPNTYERGYYLATLALAQHARKHFPEQCPPRWQFWDRHVRVEWLNHEIKYHEGDRLPAGVDHNPGDYIDIVGSVRIGTGDFHKVRVVVDMYPYPYPNKYYQEMEVTVNYQESPHAETVRTRHFQKDLLPESLYATGLVFLV